MPLGERTTASIARFGTAQPATEAAVLKLGPLQLSVVDSSLGPVIFDGIEVVRGLAFPVRDADWATIPATVTGGTRREENDAIAVDQEFTTGPFDGRFSLIARQENEEIVLEADLRLTARDTVRVNRAGFVLLHPLSGVVGTPLTVRHPDGASQSLRFPERLSPGQPVFDIQGMCHEVSGISVDIAFEGEIFEMEDQRNWTDASFKTYCRPLSAPRPFDVTAGETVQQRIVIRLSGKAAAVGDSAARQHGVMPEIAMAADETLAPFDKAAAATIGAIPFSEIQLRVDALHPVLPAALPAKDIPLALEVVIPAGADTADALNDVARICAEADLKPARVIALPEGYLASHQPEGPWPDGTTPKQAAEAARAAFPDAEIGGGMLTNFTEFNRCPPDFDSDYVTFGTTAIVHDAADRAVLETLEAMKDVFSSARAIAGARPVRLGLVAVGMRSNPYGSAVADNPEQIRLEMAQADPRQRGLFAAAFTVGAAAMAAAGGVSAFAPAMATGPLGIVHRPTRWPQPDYGSGGEVYPLFHVVRALSTLSGEQMRIDGKPPDGVIAVRADRQDLCGLAANLGTVSRTLDLEGANAAILSVETFERAHEAGWLDRAPRESGVVTLAPLDIAFLFAGTET